MTQVNESVLALVSVVSSDVLGLLGLIVLFVAFGLSKGKDNLIVLLVSLYPAALITKYFPYYDQVLLGGRQLTSVLGPLFIFLATTIVAFFIFRNFIDTNYQHHNFWRFVEVIALSIANIGLTLIILYHIVGIEILYNFSFVFDMLFTSNLAMLIWLIFPLASIPMFIRK